jgi:hypothetical protein
LPCSIAAAFCSDVRRQHLHCSSRQQHSCSRNSIHSSCWLLCCGVCSVQVVLAVMQARSSNFCLPGSVMTTQCTAVIICDLVVVAPCLRDQSCHARVCVCTRLSCRSWPKRSEDWQRSWRRHPDEDAAAQQQQRRSTAGARTHSGGASVVSNPVHTCARCGRRSSRTSSRAPQTLRPARCHSLE